MNVHDYLIDCSSFDWPKLVANWPWRLPNAFSVCMMNRFGDLFLKTEDGKVHLLRLDDGSLTCVADSHDQFCDRLDQGNNANDWLMIPLVDRLVAAGKTLGATQCYGFVLLPIHEGSYSIENIEIRDVCYQYAALGPIYEMLKDIPDGTSVIFCEEEKEHD